MRAGARALTLMPGLVIPRRGLMELRRALEGNLGHVEFGNSSGYLGFSSGRRAHRAHHRCPVPRRTIQVIPRAPARGRDQPRSVSRLAQRISLVASEETWGVRLSVSPRRLRIESDNPDLGQGPRRRSMSA